MATKYAEALLSVKYRVKTSDGTMLGGPMYALENGMHAKWLAVLFCIFTSIAAFGIGNMVQANSISVMMKETFAVSPFISGGIMALLTGVVIIGGVKSIAAVCEKLVPFMAIFYVAGCVLILAMNSGHLLEAVVLIFQSAFTPQAAGGGFVGASVMIAARYGIARGLFSNESGLGSAPIVAAAAQTKNPVRQALVSMTGTFWDTVIVCAMTGLVLVSSVLNNSLALVWDLADAMNAMMAIPNLIALIALNGVIVVETNRYLWEEGGLDRASEETARDSH